MEKVVVVGGGEYFVLFGLDIASWDSIKTYKIFLVKADINRVFWHPAQAKKISQEFVKNVHFSFTLLF